MPASSPGRAQSTPTPVGPSILCAEKANTSHPSASTSTGRWGALCAPSTSSSAPADRAISAISAIGLIVPSTFDMCVTLTSFVRAPMSARSESRSSRPSASIVRVAQRRARAPRQQLPGHDVRVVLHQREDDLVALAQVGVAPGARHEVDRLRRVAGEDDVLRVPRADVPRRLRAHPLVGVRRLHRERVDAAVDVRVLRLVVARQRLDDGARLLRRRGVVEVDQRMAVHLAPEDGEVLPQPRRIEFRAHASAPSARSFASTSALSSSRTASAWPLRSSGSPRKPRTSSPTAPSRVSPRDWM